MFKWVVGRFKVPFNQFEQFLDEVDPHRFSILVNDYYEEKKTHYEFVSYAFKVGYVSARTGKHIEMFESRKSTSSEGDNPKTIQLTEEEREREINALNEMFSK